MRILIVEDEVKIRVGISRLISTHSSHIIVGEAKNGKEGVEMAQRYHPELIITDIRMPVMNGLDMLAVLKEHNICPHSIILSGYSEFDYAKKAITLGADDYLLKPLAAEDVREALGRIEEKLNKEKCRIEGTPQGYIRDIILGSLPDIQENYEKLANIGGLELNRHCYLVIGYLGNVDGVYFEHCGKRLEQLVDQNQNTGIYVSFIENTQEYICLIQNEWSQEEVYKKLGRRIYLDSTKEGQAVWAMVRLTSLQELPTKVAAARRLYPYGMVLGYTHLLTEEEVRSFVPAQANYPVFLENKMKVEICKGDSEKLLESELQFQRYMREQSCEPYHIRQAYMKVVHFVLNISQEVAPDGYRLIQDQNPIRTLGNAITLAELELCFLKIIKTCGQIANKKEDIRNYTVNRAISYIREHYKEVISLDEMARRLEITPEYLSTLFNKEVGINFSTFLKKFRISQAKRLLKGSELKIYEVANEVGYGDAKYFNRVFREEVGVSPGDYRQS